MPAHDRVRGICLSPEGQVSRADGYGGIVLGGFNSARANSVSNLDRVFDLFPLSERKTQAAGLMSGGEQQMLAIARALMGSRSFSRSTSPRSGSRQKLFGGFDAIKTIAQSGITILLVEQNTRAALTVAERGYVLSAGKSCAKARLANLCNRR